MSDTIKSIAIKFIGSNRATATVKLQPGTTVADVMKQLKLSTDNFQLSNSTTPDIIMEASNIIYAMVEDGDMVHCSARVIAGAM